MHTDENCPNHLQGPWVDRVVAMNVWEEERRLHINIIILKDDPQVADKEYSSLQRYLYQFWTPKLREV